MTRKHRSKPVIHYTLEWSFVPEIGHAILSTEFKVNEQRFARRLIVDRKHFDMPGTKQEAEQEVRHAIIKYFIRNKANVILVGPIESTNE